MNDSKEFEHALEITKQTLVQRKQSSNDEMYLKFCDGVYDLMERMTGTMNIYVACFSEVSDALSQWRGYCPPSFGYSLGFNGDILRKLANEQSFILDRCRYNEHDQRLEVANWVDQTLGSLMGLGIEPSIHSERYTQAAIGFLDEFLRFAPFLKHPAFEDEKEWRLVSTTSHSSLIRFRPGRSMLIPYMPFSIREELNNGLLWDVRVGPTPHPEQSMTSVTQLLIGASVSAQNGVTRSFVPYRDW